MFKGSLKASLYYAICELVSKFSRMGSSHAGMHKTYFTNAVGSLKASFMLCDLRAGISMLKDGECVNEGSIGRIMHKTFYHNISPTIPEASRHLCVDCRKATELI